LSSLSTAAFPVPEVRKVREVRGLREFRDEKTFCLSAIFQRVQSWRN
jgi:hypothetical protein